jgi:TonB family protein
MSYLGPSLRRRRRATRPGKRIALAVVVSLAVHGLVLWRTKVDFLGTFGKEVRPVSLSPLSAAQWDANRAIRDSNRPPPPGTPSVAIAPPPPPEQKPPQEKAPGQVVDVAPSKDHTPPKDSRFVSDQNNRVEKETRSRHAHAGYAHTLPVPTQNKAGTQGAETSEQPPVAVGEGGRPGSTPKPPASGRPGARPEPKQEKLALRDDPSGAHEPPEHRPPQPSEGLGTPDAHPGEQSPPGPTDSGVPGRPGLKADLSRLMPSAAAYNRLTGGPAPDHLDGVAEGEGTVLNTREWKYATYFNRVKQAVAPQWDPHTPLQARDPTGKMFLYKDRITVLDVTLDDRGGLRHLAIEQSSGVDFLDQAAMDAFRKAEPFVNPPRGLANTNGEIQFVFAFYLETGGPLRIFRGPTP